MFQRWEGELHEGGMGAGVGAEPSVAGAGSSG